MAISCALMPWLLLLSGLAAAAAVVAKVPESATFRYVNDGEFGPFITEYDDSYRGTPLFGSPYQLMWHNSTPGQFYIGIRLGLKRQEPFFRWVWDANRGRPVGENATLTFGADGDLVLAEADGRVVWSTGTAGKGVVGISLLSTGNLVLYDGKGRFVWQSFDYPTDTLFAGQTLRLTGPTKLVSRESETENSEGKYSLVLEPRAVTLYMDAAPKPLPYGRFSLSSPVTNMTFEATPDDNNVWNLGFGGRYLARPKFNATISILRLQINGNLVSYTYNEQVDSEPTDRTFVFFSDGTRAVQPGCDLPSKCGSLGVCTEEMCVACPTPKGLLGWSESCSAPRPGCKGGGGGYYKVVGVENYLTRFSKGMRPVTAEDCKRRCSKDCRCLGFFYWEEASRCWLAPALGTLGKVSNSSHVAYIKT